MGYKRFASKDVVYNRIITKPQYKFLVNSSSIYLQNEREVTGDFSNKIKHIPSGHVSLHEININRPSGSLIHPFIINSSELDSIEGAPDDLELGDPIYGKYPLSASLSRIFIPSGIELNTIENGEVTEYAHPNKKYIRALRNTISFQNRCGSKNSYGSLGTDNVNMICVPAIFYGSQINPGSIKLSTYITGVLAGTAEDLYSNGTLVETYNSTSPATPSYDEVGVVSYNQGILILSSSKELNSLHEENYQSSDEEVVTTSKWINFGTGINQIPTGAAGILSHGACPSSSYTVEFQGTNKIPTMTMYAYSNMADHNYSHNPTYIEEPRIGSAEYSKISFTQKETKIKNINKSEYSDHQEDFENTTYISKVGIYDKHKNLIAIASLAKPVKKTEKRDFVFKIGIDF